MSVTTRPSEIRPEVIINIILRPWQIVPLFVDAAYRSLILELFGPLTFLPFLSSSRPFGEPRIIATSFVLRAD